MPVLSYVHQLFNAEQCQPISIHCGGKIVPSNVPGARARTSIRGGSTTTDPGANATGATAASAPSTTSPIPCSTRASGRCRTGFWRPFCSVCRVRRGALPGSWGSIAARAIAGAGGCAMRPCPMRWIASWRARWKRMTSITPPATRAKPHRAGKKPLGRRAAWAPQEARARPGALRQRSAGDHRLGQSPGGGRHPGDPRFHGEDGAEGGRHRGPSGQSALYRLGQQLPGVEGLCARVRQSHEEGIRPW